MRGRIYAGTSGFAYKTWKPGFYPPRLKAADMLRYYAERLPSVEINNTFYRMPTEKLLCRLARRDRRDLRVHAQGSAADHAHREAA